MPRKGRIDYPGALHHVIIRGINRSAIFKDCTDRRAFISRLGKGLNETGLSCYGWTLIPNHVHLVLRTGPQPLTKLMGSLLTGYAMYFNRRHKRVGYLFQNRYKSILCDEEKYILQLVRYIHLNPFRAGLVPDVQTLNTFPWCGHAVILGKREAGWQDVETILGHFGSTRYEARRAYLDFVKKGISEGRRNDLVGGGLLRSAGGWQEVFNLRRGGERWRGDERMLGDSDFVQQALKTTEEHLTKNARRKAAGWTLQSLLDYIARLSDLDGRSIRSGKKGRPLCRARALFSWWATEELGCTATETAVFLGISPQAVSPAARRGQVLAEKKDIRFPQVS